MDQVILNKRPLGQTGLAVSPLGLGTVKFGRNQNVKYPHAFEIPAEKELAALLSLAGGLGINVLDTAPAYGQSEERLGRLLNGQRKNWIVVSKAGEEFQNGQSIYDFSPAYFEDSLLRSLKRLQTDYLDVFLIHSNGEDMPILGEEALIEKLYDLKKRGLVRAVGASTKTPEGGIMALELLDVVMAAYNPGYTDEKSVLDYAAKKDKGLFVKKALSGGHATDIQSAFDFALAHPGAACIVAGTINRHHLRENADAASLALRKKP